jgi:hypothetical protein
MKTLEKLGWNLKSRQLSLFMNHSINLLEAQHTMESESYPVDQTQTPNGKVSVTLRVLSYTSKACARTVWTRTPFNNLKGG